MVMIMNEKNKQVIQSSFLRKFPTIKNFKILKDKYVPFEIIAAAQKGDVARLRNLRKVYKLTAKDARSNNNEAFGRAVRFQNIPVLKELREGYGLDNSDARSNDNAALRNAALKGHVKVLKELREGYGLGKSDARANNNQALKYAHEKGDSAIIKELEEGYGISL